MKNKFMENLVFGIIYVITNKINGKVYIGQTIRKLNERIQEHKYSIIKRKSTNEHLLNAFKKYGWNNFETKEIDIAYTIDELNEKEIYYIKQYNSTNKQLGYNIADGGRNSKASPETIEKMSKAHKGVKQSDIWIKNRIFNAGTEEAKRYGKIKTDDEKQYLSENSPKFWQGKSRSEETKNKISNTKIAKGLSVKQKEIYCKTVYIINIETNIVLNEYFSTGEAAKFLNVDQTTVSRRCSKNAIINNTIWTYNKEVLNKN